jgi:hypothetical protein
MAKSNKSAARKSSKPTAAKPAKSRKPTAKPVGADGLPLNNKHEMHTRAVELARAFLPKGWRANPAKAETDKSTGRPVSIDSVILRCLKAASANKPATKPAVLAALMVARPDKTPERMAETLSQMPNFARRQDVTVERVAPGQWYLAPAKPARKRAAK